LQVSITPTSSLVVNGAGVTIKSLDVDGALVIDAAPGVELVIEGLTVKNKGLSFVPLSEEETATADEVLQLRGYKAVRNEVKEIKVPNAGRYTYRDGGLWKS
jgi:hypothetical protein